MNYGFLNKENTGRLIIIFAGWSTGPDFYRHIHVEGWDTLVVYGYNDFDFPGGILDGYHTIVLFAWSLGVYMASKTIPTDRVALAVAVNGTTHPVDDSLGIPEKIFSGTAATLNPRNLLKFRRRMCAEKFDTVVEKFDSVTEKFDSDDLRGQLEFIMEVSKMPDSQPMNSNEVLTPFRWHRAYISDSDTIFPPQAQQRAWEEHASKPEIVHLDAPHYVDLHRIIVSAVPAKESIGKRFHKALATYDKQAVAQRAIARRLVDFPGGVTVRPAKVLEIGVGSGIFTKLFADRFHPDHIDYVDLYPLPNFGHAPEERYFTEDAEEHVAALACGEEQRYDAVVSASALQWFANPELFFRNVAAILRPGGFLLCSTFLPGNLGEMQTANPYGLIYRPIEELEEMLRKHFLFTKLEEETLIMDFASPLETMRHLKETGVGGGIDTGRSPRQLLETIPLRLTYRPLYIYAVKAPYLKPENHDN